MSGEPSHLRLARGFDHPRGTWCLLAQIVSPGVVVQLCARLVRPRYPTQLSRPLGLALPRASCDGGSSGRL